MNSFSHNLQTILFRAYSEMRADVRSNSLGMILWILEPLCYLGAFYIILSALELRGGTSAVPFLLVGLVAWKWFATSVRRGAVALINAASIMQQINVPKIIFLASTLLSSFYQFLIVFTLFIIFILLYGIEPNWGWINLTLIIILEFLLIIGVAGLFAVLLPFSSDLKVVLTNGLTLAFFMSGIFFEIESVPESYQRILYLNPMASIIEAYRDILFTGTIRNWNALGIIALISLILIVLSLYLLKKWSRIYPRLLPT